MRANVQTNDLAEALKLSAAATKTTMPVLQHVLMTAHADSVSLETTDCEVHIRATIPADVEEQGAVLMHEQLLRPVATGDGAIRINADGRVSRGRSHYRIPVIADPTVFPDQEAVRFVPMDLDPLELADAIRQVAYSGDEGDVRAMMRAVHVQTGRVWATDGVQMGRVRVAYDGPSVAIPVYQVKRVLDALRPGAKLAAGHVAAGRAGHLRIDAGNLVVSLRLIDTVGVDVDKLVPKLRDNAPRAEVERAPLVAALRRFMPFGQWTGQKAVQNWTVVLELAGTELTLADRAEESREDLSDMVTASNGKFRICFDPKMLLAALNAIRTEKVTLYPGPDAKTPMVIQPDGTDTDDIAHLLAPMTI